MRCLIVPVVKMLDHDAFEDDEGGRRVPDAWVAGEGDPPVRGVLVDEDGFVVSFLRERLK